MTAQIGRPIDRVEGHEKVTGTARYTADHQVPGLVHAVLVQSEVAHATVTAESVAAAAARAAAAPGVLHVLTPLNCPPLHVLPEDLTWDLPLERRPPLSDLTVQHVGQHLAVVVAETVQDAVAAAALMDFVYIEAPAQLGAAAVMAQPVPPTRRAARSGTAHIVPITSSNSMRRSCRNTAARSRNPPASGWRAGSPHR